MRLRHLLPAFALLGLVVILAIGLTRDPREVPSPLVGKPAPDFSLSVLGASPDTRLTTAELRGRPVLVNFFASWCAACVIEHPFLMQLAAQGVEVIGVDYKDTEAEVSAWLARHGNPYRTIALDPEGAAGLDWGVYGAPETYVLDAQGVIVHKQIGPLDETIWREKIAPLLATTR